MAELPDDSGEEEGMTAWKAREAVLSSGLGAAMALEHWDEALQIIGETVASKQRRSAPPLELAKTLFNAWPALQKTGRQDEARSVLNECRLVFEQEHDILLLGTLFGALGDIERDGGKSDLALSYFHRALRYFYQAHSLDGASTFHVASARLEGPLGAHAIALAHYLAAALILRVMGANERSSGVVAEAARFVAATGSEDALPHSLAELYTEVNRVEGIHLEQLLDRLPEPWRVLEEFLAALSPEGITLDAGGVDFDRWDAQIALVAAAAMGNQNARDIVDSLLPQWDVSDALARAIRRVARGERSEQVATEDLDSYEAAVVQRMLAAAGGLLQVRLDAGMRQGMLPEWTDVLIAAIIGARRGDEWAACYAEVGLGLMAETGGELLMPVMLRIIEGERQRAQWLATLNVIEAAIADRLMAALDGRGGAAIDSLTEDKVWISETLKGVVVVAKDSAAPTARQVNDILEKLSGTELWASLAAALQRIVGGERDGSTLTHGLDAFDTDYVSATLSRISEMSP
jgi:tetratricopeptide (TPR) repeat protein